MSIDLQVITSPVGFKQLKDQWNALYGALPGYTIFSSWDWMYTWWEVYQDQYIRELLILCFYEKERLIGLAPLQIVSGFPKSLVQGKTLCFIGSGESRRDKILSQYNDLMALPGNEQDVIDGVSSYLKEHKNKWCFADFQFLLADSLISKCFEELNTDIFIREEKYGSRYFIPPMGGFENYKASMKKRWAKMFEKKTRLLHRDGEVRTENIETPDEIDENFKRLADMHNERWQDKTRTNIFESERFRNFHLKVMKRLQPQSKCYIKTLFLEEQPLAAYYCFTDKKQVHYYQSGFYSKHANKYSPLFLLVCNEIGDSIENKKKFDFMYTDKTCSYKKEQYAANHVDMFRVKWTNQKYRFFVFDCAKYVQMKILKINKLLKV